ncbi:hypothetical protein KC221_28990, partial [Mycobacterium tuberculosis]|nr:hypothetical protein [Mycobacterium tuberculosis]
KMQDSAIPLTKNQAKKAESEKKEKAKKGKVEAKPLMLTLTGAKGNNLKNVTLNLPIGVFTAITGVSGSGKSTLINRTLLP